MKFLIGTAAFLLVLTSAPAFAQDEPKPQQQEEHKPQDSAKPPAQEKAPPAKPEAERPKDQPASTEKPARPAVKAQEKQTEQQTKEQQDQQKKTQQQQQKAQQAQSHSAAQAHQSTGDSHRIPDDKFRAHFGAQHHFRPSRGGNRFQYGGYWFAYNDPWPSGWATEDDCYIEDDGGVYYLIDAIHPEFRLLLVVQVS